MSVEIVDSLACGVVGSVFLLNITLNNLTFDSYLTQDCEAKKLLTHDIKYRLAKNYAA
ncbi:hypothetical protein ALT761_02255 [Alteromonas sp. 76-1]|jgi:hypothetical protein|uniref:hypothetical protein n=1 Tax=Alteromonas sp. 76-1 TaxID=2358187 RepID=UPI000FD185C2|nr:hypothetical protein [Alteromonas sp. 76-1]VEL97254.1 hypothetical protein ALT761_02255 [Alteromonas sp. 76-1]